MWKQILLIPVAIAIASPAMTKDIRKTVFGEIDVDAFCLPASDGGDRVLDLDKLACHLFDGGKACGKELGAASVLKQPLRAWLEKKYFGSLNAIVAAQSSNYFHADHQPNCPGYVASDGVALVHESCAVIRCRGRSGQVLTDAAGGGFEAPGGLRLRLTPDDFADKDLKTTDPTIASLSRNFENGGNTFLIKGALGYQFAGYAVTEPDGGKFVPWTFTPYVGVDRIENTGAGKSDTTNIYVGASADVLFTRSRYLGIGVHQFAASGRLVSDEEADSLIADATLLYRPYPSSDLFTQGISLGPVWLVVRPSARLDAGIVFDPGTKPKLQLTNDYLRAGGSLKATFFDSPRESNFLDGFSLSVDYTWAYGISGLLDEFQRFEASLDYTIPSAPNFGFSIRYVNGDVPVTLEEEESLLASFAVRF